MYFCRLYGNQVDYRSGQHGREGEEIQSPYYGCIEVSEEKSDYLEAWFDGDKYFIGSDGEAYDADGLDFEDEDDNEDWDNYDE